MLLSSANSVVGNGSSRKYGSCSACSEVIRLLGSMVRSFCSWRRRREDSPGQPPKSVSSSDQGDRDTYQQEDFTVWLDFVLLHVLD